MPPGVPLVIVHVKLSDGHVMVVDVIVTPVCDCVPTVGPQVPGKVELAVFKVTVPELYVNVPFAFADAAEAVMVVVAGTVEVPVVVVVVVVDVPVEVVVEVPVEVVVVEVPVEVVVEDAAFMVMFSVTAVPSRSAVVDPV
jgi:hypothetical protein